MEVLENNIILLCEKGSSLMKFSFSKIFAQYINMFDVRNFLNMGLKDRQIGNSVPIKWPARSPDLTRNDFLWPSMHNSIYPHDDLRPSNREKLRMKIIEVTLGILINVQQIFYDRLYYCSCQEKGLYNI